ncbi:hypothetical protein G7067_07210 [Leucobacter insecticola]|uniref:Uncharacterized protein n=1 Tax=Leucobacter insecticola TaxID=2714934 RepID=A0A6G8FIU6_9MICO|nr:hypothetical protein [Leucobacter insecticola]QIM16258.1 hypothetical protein G7067_07210 [Leucobacter insecticola]
MLQDFPGEGVDLVEIALQSKELWLTFAVLRMLDSHWRGVCLPEHVLDLAKEAERTWEEAKVKVQSKG